MLRLFVLLDLFDVSQAAGMLTWPHSGFHVHTAVRVSEDDCAFATRLARYCARHPVALARLTYDRRAKAVPHRSDTSAGPTAGTATADPLACPTCHGAMRVVALITQPSVSDQILTHLRATRHATPRGGPACPLRTDPTPGRRAGMCGVRGGRTGASPQSPHARCPRLGRRPDGPRRAPARDHTDQ